MELGQKKPNEYVSQEEMESVIKEEAKESGTTGILLEKCNKKTF